ncbi:kinase-like domain-containing protein [Kockovaella imperatae]|uniref:non-specific serine/threonine protein kinase n=1 Tax=Kockovaella imperatae TaxID=4999 RepID=A0A1Y1UI76_9TREE|nr:kinase-like domain-containing protein [Kockovaella imperatae]ORX37751.1 kinase-like domain-containing protein [Kockovaella imperatae]
MPLSSYAERASALGAVLDELDDTPPIEGLSAELEMQANSELLLTLQRGRKLDSLLIDLWDSHIPEHDDLALEVGRLAESTHLGRRDFESQGTVGQGQYGTIEAVKLCGYRCTYALKTIRKDLAWRNRAHLGLSIERHIHILAGLDVGCATVPSLFAAFQDIDCYHLVLPYAPFGSLWDRMSSLPRKFGTSAVSAPEAEDRLSCMTEEEVLWWAPQMVSAICWVHEKGFAHRDVKPQNFLLFPDSQLQLTDFGSAAPLERSLASYERLRVPITYCSLVVGTPDYLAPEILILAKLLLNHSKSGEDSATNYVEQGYGSSIDWWSLGATLHEMLRGLPPFWRPSVPETYQTVIAVEDGSYKISEVNGVSESLSDFLCCLLCPSHLRLGAADDAEIRDHAVFKDLDWTKLLKRPRPAVVSNLPPIALSRSGIGSHTSSFLTSSFGKYLVTNDISSTIGPTIFQDHRDLATTYHHHGWSLEPSAREVEGLKDDISQSLAMRTPARGTDFRQTPTTITKSAPRHRPLLAADAWQQVRTFGSPGPDLDMGETNDRFASPSSSNQVKSLETWHDSLRRNIAGLHERLRALQDLASAG